jgi:short-subunit dehydrogenase
MNVRKALSHEVRAHLGGRRTLVPEAIAKAALAAVAKKRDVVYAPLFWWGIMTIIRHIPERIFKKLNI